MTDVCVEDRGGSRSGRTRRSPINERERPRGKEVDILSSLWSWIRRTQQHSDFSLSSIAHGLFTMNSNKSSVYNVNDDGDTKVQGKGFIHSSTTRRLFTVTTVTVTRILFLVRRCYGT